MERTAVLDKGQLLDDIGTSILAIPEHPKPYWELDVTGSRFVGSAWGPFELN